MAITTFQSRLRPSFSVSAKKLLIVTIIFFMYLGKPNQQFGILRLSGILSSPNPAILINFSAINNIILNLNRDSCVSFWNAWTLLRFENWFSKHGIYIAWLIPCFFFIVLKPIVSKQFSLKRVPICFHFIFCQKHLSKLFFSLHRQKPLLRCRSSTPSKLMCLFIGLNCHMIWDPDPFFFA